MKKNRIIMALLLFVALIGLTACGGGGTSTDKTPLTAADFKSKMEAKSDFKVVDDNQQFAGNDSIVQVYIAYNGKFQIEFYEQKTEADAKASFDLNKSNFEAAKDSNAVTTIDEKGNWSKYTQVSGGKFGVVSKIGNTFIYVNVDEQYKDDVNSILQELGY